MSRTAVVEPQGKQNSKTNFYVFFSVIFENDLNGSKCETVRHAATGWSVELWRLPEGAFTT
jgi:hypothetical protein